MAEIFDTSNHSELLSGTRKARQAIASGKLIVLPTDTVYGVAADAFKPDAVASLLAAKGRNRLSPPPVLVANMNGVRALAENVTTIVERIAEAFWPGPLTMVFPVQPSLDWDLGETHGTVALRIPDHEVTLEILQETGPLAVSSANLTGKEPALEAFEADEMIGDKVQVILDAGKVSGGESSTIIDVTQLTMRGGVLRILRKGPVTADQLAELCPEVTVALAPKNPPKAALAKTADVAPEESQEGESVSVADNPVEDNGGAVGTEEPGEVK